MENVTEAPVEWRISDRPEPYESAVQAMEQRVEAIRAGAEPELVWLLEHPPLYTAGTSADPRDLQAPDPSGCFLQGLRGRGC